MKLGSTGSNTARIGTSLVVAAVLTAAPALGADPPATASKPPAQTESQREAAAVLREMVTYLGGLKAFTVTSRHAYQTLQPTGQMIEFGETRRVSLARPDRLRVEEVSSDGRKDLALFDGKLITALNADAGVYAQAPQPGSVDDALVYFVRDLRMRMPLAQLLSTRVGTDLPELVKEIDYVESTDLLGVATHHIAGRTDSTEFQFWIAEGDRPLPLRVVIRYVAEKGQPQFWAEFSNWNTNPQLTNSTFQLVLPKDARKIAFAVQVPRTDAAPQPAAATGEVKP
jgi:hypothetical protein